MYTVEISDRINAIELKSKKELKDLLENVCPPLKLKYPSIDWIVERLKLNKQIKLQCLPNYMVIRRNPKGKAKS